ncbi:MAG: mercuric reductase [Rubripirellula sp.]|nr:mercuric reductase [Rubripirellula sp.]
MPYNLGLTSATIESTKEATMYQSDLVQLQPTDEHNQKLEANVHPPAWVNPVPSQPYHLVIIGAGTAGLVTAAGAAGLGARVALVERELMGGDCLNVGCVPSKGLIRAARVAATVRDAEPFGVKLAGDIRFDFAKAMRRMRELRAQISPNDSAERFSELGVDVFFGQAAFADNSTVSVNRSDGAVSQLQYKKAVIASGARASAPDIDGLQSVDYLTNENLFSLTELPPRLAVVGTGPVGVEMAQSFARFGSEVVLFDRGDQVLPREDPDAGAILAKQLQRDGIRLMLGSQEMKFSPADNDCIRVSVKQAGETVHTLVDQLLIAVGRAPNTEALNLESVGVKYDQNGIQVSDHLQTTNPRIYAAGDVCSKFKFTHAADFQARIVIQNSLFSIGPFGKKKASQLIIPWATYTAPEIAHVGLNEKEATQQGIPIDTYTQRLADVDRAILEGQDEGFVKVHTKRGSDLILGATIVAENAGDLICELTLAMQAGVGLSKIAATIHPYPTQADAIRKLGDQYNRTKLTPASKRILDLLRRINVGK